MIAIFPGRFQPPHVGHILTLIRLHDKYDKIIIAVTRFTHWGAKPPIIAPELSAEILTEIFKHMPKYEVVLTDKGFPDRSTFDDLPPFDVVLTGTEISVKHLLSLGIRAEFVPRSDIGEFEISGVILRRALRNE